MTSPNPRNAGPPSPRRRRRPRHPGSQSGDDWLWGTHAVAAALANPERGPALRLLATPERARRLVAPGVRIETVEAAELRSALPPGAVHQGLAGRFAPLPALALEAIAAPAHGLLLMLDQVTDPQNVGAIFRSAAAFGARGLLIQARHAPPFSGALAKAAAGAIETIPCARLVNLARALERLAALGWRSVGLDAEAPLPLARVLDGRPTVLVLGAEGEGLRRLVAEHCDERARIPMPGGFASLNVAVAAAVALYEATRGR